MTPDPASDLESTTLVHRLVLLGVASRAEDRESPVHSADVEDACLRHLDAVDGDVVGTLSEGDVMRALNELEAADFLEMADLGDTSPVGKGRPHYDLCVDADSLLDALADDVRLTRAVDRVRDDR